MAKPPSPEAVVRLSPRQTPGQAGCAAWATISCCACGGAELHMRSPNCMCVGAPPGRVFPVARASPCSAQALWQF
eukprot:478207-Alexandrium_andersonii.AAC.1